MVSAGQRIRGTTVVVVTGGDTPDPGVCSLIPADAFVVAADSGADLALALGLRVHEAVGDFDSVSPAGLAALHEAGTVLDVRQPDKDATDMELAMTAALRHTPDCIMVLGGLGGRVDHELANLTLLSGENLADVDVVVRSGRATVSLVRPPRRTELCSDAGDLVSLLTIRDPAKGVTTGGLRWPLSNAELRFGSTLGISNELVDRRAWVSCTSGVLLAMQPGVAAASVRDRSEPSVFDQRGVR